MLVPVLVNISLIAKNYKIKIYHPTRNIHLFFFSSFFNVHVHIYKHKTSFILFFLINFSISNHHHCRFDYSLYTFFFFFFCYRLILCIHIHTQREKKETLIAAISNHHSDDRIYLKQEKETFKYQQKLGFSFISIKLLRRYGETLFGFWNI